MASQIIGNFIGSRMIEDTSGPLFFLFMSLIMIAGIFGFSCLLIPKSQIYYEFGSRLGHSFDSRVEFGSVKLSMKSS
jgi:hypothetical protein